MPLGEHVVIGDHWSRCQSTEYTIPALDIWRVDNRLHSFAVRWKGQVEDRATVDPIPCQRLSQPHTIEGDWAWADGGKAQKPQAIGELNHRGLQGGSRA